MSNPPPTGAGRPPSEIWALLTPMTDGESLVVQVSQNGPFFAPSGRVDQARYVLATPAAPASEQLDQAYILARDAVHSLLDPACSLQEGHAALDALYSATTARAIDVERCRPAPASGEPSEEWRALNDLLYCAYKYDDKPHQFYLAVAKLAETYVQNDEQRAEIKRLMEAEALQQGASAPAPDGETADRVTQTKIQPALDAAGLHFPPAVATSCPACDDDGKPCYVCKPASPAGTAEELRHRNLDAFDAIQARANSAVFGLLCEALDLGVKVANDAPAPVPPGEGRTEALKAAKSALAGLDNIRWNDIWERVGAIGDDDLEKFSRKYVRYVREDLEKVIDEEVRRGSATKLGASPSIPHSAPSGELPSRAIADARKAINCLRLELPGEIVDSVSVLVETAFSALLAYPRPEAAMGEQPRSYAKRVCANGMGHEAIAELREAASGGADA